MRHWLYISQIKYCVAWKVESLGDIFDMLNWLGKTLLYQISFPLLSWECITYGIYSVLLLVRCTIRLIHVVPIMQGHLACHELILVLQVEIMVCGWNPIIQICGYILMGREAFLIVLSHLGWLLPVTIVCPTVSGESICLRCTVPLWSGFWRFVSLSLHCLRYDCLGALPDTWC